MKKIAVDAKWMTGQLRGMGKYALQVVEPIKNNIVLFQPKGEEPLSHSSIVEGWGFFPLWEQYILPKLCKKHEIDVLFCPYNTGPLFIKKTKKVIIVVHDLIFLKNRKQLPLSQSWYQNFGRYYRAFIVPKMIKRADYIVTVSQFTKNEMLSCFDIDSEKISVIPNSIDQAWLNLDPKILENRDDYIFTVAGDAPSKNVARLIKAFSLFKKSSNSNVLLKIAGIKLDSHAAFISISQRLGVSESIKFLNFLSTEELQSLYLNSKGFVFASTFEGFGIPLLEAMSCCVPVACSNTTSMPEVVGEFGVLFDPYSIESIADGMSKLVDNKFWSNEILLSAKERVETEYSQTKVNCQFVRFWKKINE